jgi:hypothetical protein
MRSVPGGDEVTFAAFSFLFNFHVVQVDRWGQPNRKHLQNDFLEADYLQLNPSAIVTWVALLLPNIYARKLYFPFWD